MTEVNNIISIILDGFKVSYLVSFISMILAASMTFIIFWFAVKYAVPRLMNAIRYGNINKYESVHDFAKHAADKENREWQEEFDRDSMHYFD